jgi:general secretion pathway protein D
MVKELDVRRPQVFVEALIMEMTLEKSLQLGVNWQGTALAGESAVGLGVPSAAPQTLAQTLAAGSGAVVGIVGNEIDFQGQKFASFSAFIQATRQDQDLNILANPQILTLNNEQAEINVSQVVPISSKILRDANQNTTTEFEFKDIGIILSITPQITGQDKVRLIIDQESSSVAARQAGVSDQQAITTLKRSLKTKVLVDNNATIAIGGLIQDQQVENVTKVPCLGDIPVLGWFFKSRSEEVRKTNLIVFIRPRIITTQEELEELSSDVHEKYDESRQLRNDTEGMLREDFGIAPRMRPEPALEPEGGEAPQAKEPQ